MENYQLKVDYQDNQAERLVFNQLAQTIFGIQFEDWYQAGKWDQHYRSFSYWDQDQVVANVSVHHMTINMYGKVYRGLQIGTVMTAPSYRNQGLIRKLIGLIEAEYSGEIDFIYLYANETVFNFYSKFGYEKSQELRYSLSWKAELSTSQISTWQKLSIQQSEDIQLIARLMEDCRELSSEFSVLEMEHLQWFYYLTALSDSIYYSPSLDVVVLLECEDGKLDLFDVLTATTIDIELLLVELSQEFTFTEVEFYFVPNDEILAKVTTSLAENIDEQLFVKSFGIQWPENSRLPLISQG